jgi:hypothetical protein
VAPVSALSRLRSQGSGTRSRPEICRCRSAEYSLAAHRFCRDEVVRSNESARITGQLEYGPRTVNMAARPIVLGDQLGLGAKAALTLRHFASSHVARVAAAMLGRRTLGVFELGRAELGIMLHRR